MKQRNLLASVASLAWVALVTWLLQPLQLCAEGANNQEGTCGVTVVMLARPQTTEPQSGTFQITPSFNANVPAADRAVIQQALGEWDSILQSRGVNPASYSVAFMYGKTSSSTTLAVTTVSYYADGTLAGASTVFSTNFVWFVDPTPADDGEFGQNPPAGFDLLSVARHELGHAFGWAGTSRVTGLVVNSVFDANRLNISLVAGAPAHADPAAHPNELMVPSIGPGTRRPIQLYPTGALLSRAYQYQIPMNFVDPANGGTQTGSAWQPWQTLQKALTQSPAEIPLLLAPARFGVSINQPLASSHTLLSARGGASVVAQ